MNRFVVKKYILFVLVLALGIIASLNCFNTLNKLSYSWSKTSNYRLHACPVLSIICEYCIQLRPVYCVSTNKAAAIYPIHCSEVAC